MARLKYMIDALNEICVAAGGSAGHTTMIAALNNWAVAAGGAGTSTTTIAALNVIAGRAGGVTTSVTDLAAANVIAVALSGTGGKTTYITALLDILDALGGDVTAPVLSAMTATETSDNEIDIGVDSDDNDGVIYFVLTTNSNEPNPEQIIAGLDGGFQAAAYANTIDPVIVGTNEGQATGLDESTVYYAFAVQVDDAGNISNVTTATATTEAGMPAAPEMVTESGNNMVSEGEAPQQMIKEIE